MHHLAQLYGQVEQGLSNAIVHLAGDTLALYDDGSFFTGPRYFQGEVMRNAHEDANETGHDHRDYKGAYRVP